MNTYQVTLSREADQDLITIAEYIALDNPSRAVSFIANFQKAIQETLSIFPEKHRQYKDCRVWPYHNYLVLYDIHEIEKTVEVLAIANAATT